MSYGKCGICSICGGDVYGITRDSYHGSFITSTKQAFYFLDEIHKLRARIEGSERAWLPYLFEEDLTLYGNTRAWTKKCDPDSKQYYLVPVEADIKLQFTNQEGVEATKVENSSCEVVSRGAWPPNRQMLQTGTKKWRN